MLIMCPECKKQISENAKSCPKCGFVIEDASRERLVLEYKRQTARANRRELFVAACILLLVSGPCITVPFQEHEGRCFEFLGEAYTVTGEEAMENAWLCFLFFGVPVFALGVGIMVYLYQTSERKVMIKYECVRCKAKLSADADRAGQVEKCPECGYSNTIPERKRQFLSEDRMITETELAGLAEQARRSREERIAEKKEGKATTPD